MRCPAVLVFDSGIGGLSVAQHIAHQIPGMHLTYLADNAGFPYGNQPDELVISRCVGMIRRSLLQTPADVVVIACNTASTVALPALRAAIEVPVVGVVPAIKPASALSVNRRIGLLATPATIRRPYLNRLVAEFAADCTVEPLGHPDLVHWIEAWAAGEASLPLAALSRTLQPFRSAGVDTVVLGCTHYPLIAQALRRQLPEVRHWVDSGDAIARRTRHLLLAGGPGVFAANRTGPVQSDIRFSGPWSAVLETYIEGLGFALNSISGD
ncbi:MAG: glutamate racemase [Oleiphilaceae bacterium]|nr:glutamate racemase [Oleiphilaceae bacterium]